MALLEKLNSLRMEKALIKLSWPDVLEPVAVKPLQYLEEDYVSYLVEVQEDNENFKKGNLLEVMEEDLEYVKEA